tara:strand:- start:4633 stop:5055 length:423 start_codon:yes stop_codon:yes gene_type:complete
MEENYSWIYLLIFLIIPLARIIPRLLKRGRYNPNVSTTGSNPRRNFFEEKPDNFQASPSKKEYSTKNWPKEKIVLGLLITKITKFEEIQKRANLSTNNLDAILQDFETKGFMTPVEKSGPFGKSIELRITEKGTSEFGRM